MPSALPRTQGPARSPSSPDRREEGVEVGGTGGSSPPLLLLLRHTAGPR